MKISEVMTPEVAIVGPDDSMQEAAILMDRFDTGALPVGDGDGVVGIVTDRDIVIRGVAAGKDLGTAVRDLMTDAVEHCYADDEVEQAARLMAEHQVRRLPVLDRERRLVGIVSLGDLALQQEAADQAGRALSGISQPSGEHSQSTFEDQGG
ncbi:MAG: CBS domain-containing protein [Dongiaceae bacterium]